MSQIDIVNVLKTQEDKWFNSRQIANFLGYTKNQTTVKLKQLRKFGVICFQTKDRFGKIEYEYKYRRE